MFHGAVGGDRLSRVAQYIWSCTVYTIPMPPGIATGRALRSTSGPSTSPKTRPVSSQSLDPNSRTIRRIELSWVARSMTTRGTQRLPLSSRAMQGLMACWPAAANTVCGSLPDHVAEDGSHTNDWNSTAWLSLEYTTAKVFPLNIPSCVEYSLDPAREGPASQFAPPSTV